MMTAAAAGAFAPESAMESTAAKTVSPSMCARICTNENAGTCHAFAEAAPTCANL
eukprot:CAMPEP_0180502806 /NCGR_PEP_ID=MMETSP1036_2-20121128/45653_1 /TAXON_ID=632150 /ORGANISM="Azadinium spinosum, Strain 3D9" /LENGTH=54 /DNA_ID=CAMNT_0022511707 /DNA_START=25 /DNA_END=189 /DNA_ORIENTATION=+